MDFISSPDSILLFPWRKTLSRVWVADFRFPRLEVDRDTDAFYSARGGGFSVVGAGRVSVSVILWLASLWLMYQPMEMRAMLMGG